MGPTVLLPLRRKARRGSFALENPDGFGRVWTRELGYLKRQRATSRPPKPLCSALKGALFFCILLSTRMNNRAGSDDEFIFRLNYADIVLVRIMWRQWASSNCKLQMSVSQPPPSKHHCVSVARTYRHIRPKYQTTARDGPDTTKGQLK